MSRFGAIAALVFFVATLVAMSSARAEDVATPAAGPKEASKEVTCSCEDSSCGPCEVETGVTFYSAKCGTNNSRVKSCKRPTCVAVERQKQCLALLKKSKGDDKPLAEPTKATEPVLVRAGDVVNVGGMVRILRVHGPVDVPKSGTVVNVGDTFETKADGKVKIRLNDGSEMIVAANSRVTIENVTVDENTGKRKIILDLLTGKVRSRVKKKYDGENTFTVKTRTAVAGVRGTDFVASFEPGENEWVSEIRTFEGMVHLESARASDADPLKPVRSVDVPGGTYAAFVIGPPSRTDDEAEFFKSIEAGHVTAVFKMSEKERNALDGATEFGDEDLAKKAKPERAVASLDADTLCSAPSGTYNQCSFTCEGNPSGEKQRCRTELPGVACVRRICRANGVWSEQTRLPATDSGSCQPSRAVVRDCINYW